eukprot:CAMPEP_0119337358 /NCGR_PEP_ID=MMETSP1333-20130426/93847_1 /TAXON_ID=418940 /ORGANISM="Scyphosphaera apsteinii, Strain RCC1455" /LENGTH=108 /DNA_ID=CAMNT_0007348379 /DNA_START=273 /DNA_END=599 /DNA_ORIENTATION=-
MSSWPRSSVKCPLSTSTGGAPRLTSPSTTEAAMAAETEVDVVGAEGGPEAGWEEEGEMDEGGVEEARSRHTTCHSLHPLVASLVERLTRRAEYGMSRWRRNGPRKLYD